jgi:hypothetical protein|tara:strand:- start:4805 stop:5164 length:360 start_codon:yes stop_codon:yes gene_type:complete
MSQKIENSLKVSVPNVDPLTTYSDILHKMLTEKFNEFKELFKKEHIDKGHFETYVLCDDKKLFHCRFESRNEPPMEAYDSLLEKFPELHFSYLWYDWDNGPAGNDGVFGYSNHINPKTF